MTEQRTAMEFLVKRLEASSGLMAITPTICPNRAPSGTKPPYVVISLATGSDTYAQENIRVDTEMQFIVRGVVEADSPVADHMDAFIDAALSNATGGTVADEQNGYRIWCVRTRPLNLASNDSMGRTYRYAGGWYRVNVRRLI